MSVKELFIRYLQVYFENLKDSSAEEESLEALKELKSVLGSEASTFDDLVEDAIEKQLISDDEYQEIATVLRIKNITDTALRKLGK